MTALWMPLVFAAGLTLGLLVGRRATSPHACARERAEGPVSPWEFYLCWARGEAEWLERTNSWEAHRRQRESAR